MMRSLYSAVSGLKTHQTRMDVIGNNISNVNTEAFKASQVRFSEIMYQTTASASLGNGATGIGGVNAKQIGLGVSMASTTCNITGGGAAETTGNPFDLRLTDSQTTNFYIVNDGTQNVFTRAGSFYVDGNGYLCMSSTGYTVQGWQVDPTTGEIRKDTVSPLQIMSPENQTSAPEATEKAYVSGIIDKKDSNLKADGGYVMTLGFYDDLGYSYTAKFSVKPNLIDPADANSEELAGSYHITLTDILDSKGDSFIEQIIRENNDTDKNGSGTGGKWDETDWENAKATICSYIFTEAKNPDGSGSGITIPASPFEFTAKPTAPKSTENGYEVHYDENKGIFLTIDSVADLPDTADSSTFVTAKALNLDLFNTGRQTSTNTATQTSNFHDIEIDFSRSTNYYNGGTSTMKALKGAIDGEGMGKKVGKLTSLSVDQAGKIYGAYDNGNTELLGQIAVAQFANASGLEKVGSNCYTTTLNSGEFDGIGVEVNADGSKINSGELEMSNVDLSGQFTDMIVTQRGFQANSRVITTSDTLLEELINLKR